MSTITLREYQSTETDLLSTTQALQLRDHFRTYLKVERSWNGSGWLLTANHYVGVIVLADLHIVIQPKTPVPNLFYMLTYAYDLPAFRTAETFLTLGEDIFEFIVKIFTQQLQDLIRQGLYRSYIDQEADQPYLRGRLLLANHLRQNAVHLGRFSQRTNDYTADVRENQILKYTLWLLAQLSYREATLTPRLHRVYTAFNEVTHTVASASDCRQIHFTRLNQRYATPLNLAALLLRHLSLEGGQGNERFGSYLFNMNEVFEKFVGRYLQEHFQDHPTITVLLQDHLWLDVERQEQGIPDIVIQQHGLPIYVLDTKYKLFKGAPEPNDRNQLWIYSQRLKAKAALLIYPGEDVIAYQATFEGIPLYARALALTGPLADFRASCRHFAAQLISAISAP